jgi:hypothetical protein
MAPASGEIAGTVVSSEPVGRGTSANQAAAHAPSPMQPLQVSNARLYWGIAISSSSAAPSSIIQLGALCVLGPRETAPAGGNRGPLSRTSLCRWSRPERFTKVPTGDSFPEPQIVGGRQLRRPYFIFPWAVGSKWRGVGVGRTKHLYRTALSM